MIKKLVTPICIATILMCAFSASAQQQDSIYSRFSEWNLRINPFSFIESLGGIQLGLETNLDKKKKLFLVSEYGYIFINNTNSGNGSDEKEKNRNKLSGFKTKQEIKWQIANNKKLNRPIACLALEVNYLQAGISNSGWFGIGASGTGFYRYFKYQEFKEQVIEYSSVIKYVHKAYFSQHLKHHLEFYGGLGMLKRETAHKNTEGTLVQPDEKVLYDNSSNGLRPVVSVGVRVLINLKN